MNICAVVVTFNGERWIKQCLYSLKNSEAPVNIKVVDNASSDATVEIIKNDYTGVDLILPSVNLGFGKANNIAIKKGLQENADYFFLLNQDARIEKNTISYLVKILSARPAYGIVSPMHLNGSGSKLDKNFSLCLSHNTDTALLSGLFCNNLSEVYESIFVNAAAWLISAVCIKKTGLFNPIFSHYGEDEEYVRRMKYHQLKLGVCPAVQIYHDREDRKEQEFKIGNPGYLEKSRVKYLVKFSDLNKNKYRSLLTFLFRLSFYAAGDIITFRFHFFITRIKESIIIWQAFFKAGRQRSVIKKEGAYL